MGDQVFVLSVHRNLALPCAALLEGLVQAALDAVRGFHVDLLDHLIKIHLALFLFNL